MRPIYRVGRAKQGGVASLLFHLALPPLIGTKMMFSLPRTAALLLALSFSGQAAFAQAGGQTAGAAVKREVFGDWQVACAGPEGKRRCAVIQQRAGQSAGQKSSVQRIFAVELVPAADGATGTLILPFGLDLAKGVRLRIGKDAAGPQLAFKTCLPAGCLVPLQFGAEGLSKIQSAPSLAVNFFISDSKQESLPISLKGLQSALRRARDLTEK